ncbi:MAG: sigma 54-interacting transcriptional regulator [bacterium]
MADWRVWEEEIRTFPFGGESAVIWVVRCDDRAANGPLRLVFSYSWQPQRSPRNGSWPTPPTVPPLGRLLRTITSGESQQLVWPSRPPAARVTSPPRLTDSSVSGHSQDKPQDRTQDRTQDRPVPPHHLNCGIPEYQLWLEPLLNEQGNQDDQERSGALALWYDNTPPWGEAVRLWGNRFIARIGPLLSELPAWPGRLGAGYPTHGGLGPEQPGQLCLFDPAKLPTAEPPARPRNNVPAGIPLPRPVFVPGVPGAVGISRELLTCCAAIEKVATSGVNVLLYGESGTGKEIIAHAIHQSSGRRSGPFVGQNCAALPESLFESELFGHRAGAFTGASGDKKGLLEAASGGTFFLDEIGDMPLPLQIKLLRVMQERRVRRIGELESRSVDLRFVAATHKDLDREITTGRFRLDLYYRLKVIRLVIPPLRQRPEDIAHLLAYFLRRHGGDRTGRRITESALAALQSYRWPGNVRELENEVSRLLALYPDERLIRLKHLSCEVQAAAGWSVDPGDLGTLRSLDEANQLLERYLIRKAIAAAGGRKAAAARKLGLSRQGLYKKIQRYGMGDLIGQGGK